MSVASTASAARARSRSTAYLRACLTFAVQADGAIIRTVEALAPAPGSLSVLQEAFRRHHVLQCGFCTPGMLMTAQALLSQPGIPSRDEIPDALSGNYCRCTGYEAIVDAIENVARSRAAAANGRQLEEAEG